MDIQVFKGVVKDVGATYTAPEVNLMTIYTYIEFEDGQVVKHVGMLGTLENKAMAAIRSGEPVELHLNHVPKGKNAKYSLVAFRGADGRLYALEMPEPGLIHKFLPVFLFLAGFPAIMVFGLGFVFWWLAWTLYRSFKMTGDVARYLKSLNADLYII